MTEAGPSNAPGSVSEGHWDELVSTALLGTDRRDPPPPPAALTAFGDLVADVVRPDPASRMLAQVAAAVTLRRAAFVAAPPRQPLAGAGNDERPPCSVAAARRWHHLVASWPVLEDEWMLTLISRGLRVRPELVPPMLTRHRRDAVRYTRVLVAAGPIAAWLVQTFPDLGRLGDEPPPAEMLGELPPLPVPPDLADLLVRPGDEAGKVVVAGLVGGRLGHAHRAVLINVVARLGAAELPAFVDAVGGVDSSHSAYGLAVTIHDVARTRRVMLDELSTGVDSAAGL